MISSLDEKVIIGEMLNKIAPSYDLKYDGMLDILSKSFPTIRFDNLSYRIKRTMFLQLLSHSISEKLNNIILQTTDLYCIEKLSKFKTELEVYCKELLTVKFNNDIEFDESQRMMGAHFAMEWSYMNTIVPCSVNPCVLQ